MHAWSHPWCSRKGGGGGGGPALFRRRLETKHSPNQPRAGPVGIVNGGRHGPRRIGTVFQSCPKHTSSPTIPSAVLHWPAGEAWHARSGITIIFHSAPSLHPAMIGHPLPAESSVRQSQCRRRMQTGLDQLESGLAAWLHVEPLISPRCA